MLSLGFVVRDTGVTRLVPPILGTKMWAPNGAPCFSRNRFPMHQIPWCILWRRCPGSKVEHRRIKNARCYADAFCPVQWGIRNSRPLTSQFAPCKTPRGSAHLVREDRRSIRPRTGIVLLFRLPSGHFDFQLQHKGLPSHHAIAGFHEPI